MLRRFSRAVAARGRQGEQEQQELTLVQSRCVGRRGAVQAALAVA